MYAAAWIIHLRTVQEIAKGVISGIHSFICECISSGARY
jgi:hypothetical protein